jgi:uncharacterized protein YndB with AHSA1/START domain
MKLIATMQETEEAQGAIRVEDVFDTGIDDLWEACTAPERLARWIAEVSGDLRVGGGFTARFTSGWEGTGSVEVCEPPHRLVVRTREDDATEDTVVEATLTSAGDRTILVVEERGLPVDHLPAYGAGWQVHLEDLGAVLAGRGRSDLKARWDELVPAYRASRATSPARTVNHSEATIEK